MERRCQLRLAAVGGRHVRIRHAAGIWLLEQALNLKTPFIYDTIMEGGKETRVLNQEATLAARDKLRQIKETFTMAATGMKMKQAGLIKKPMYVVPNHMLEQFGRGPRSSATQKWSKRLASPSLGRPKNWPTSNEPQELLRLAGDEMIVLNGDQLRICGNPKPRFAAPGEVRLLADSRTARVEKTDEAGGNKMGTPLPI
ncbi:MAG TPA: hypothetical protein VFI31_03510 [Pirellulales bacterium]|nr:hypothetical protein [Pirellulales bacterium]